MKKAVLLIFAILFTACSLGAEEKKHDFRNVDWGMSKAQVKQANENMIPTLEDKDTISYSDKVSGLKAMLIFSFVNDKLTSAGYYFEEEHSNDNDHIDDYQKIGDLLTEKYGKPVKDEVIWKNDLFKNNPQNWGLAISAGQLVLKSKWENENTYLYMTLSGDNYRIAHLLIYQSKEYEHLDQKRLRQDTDKI
ncbi:MAG: hypothetical protein M1269_07545 [Chloroflexi bacterium]|nr:hypothetical protein [Chloroflexota bacterium]